MNIVHWGAGKLGLSLGVWNAHCGHSVTFVDVNGDTVRAINKHESPIDEPRVQYLLESSAVGATLADESVEKGVVEDADIIFIIVPTPSKKNGAFDPSYAGESCRIIGRSLRQKDIYTLIVCVSTVMPGDSRKLIEILEKESGQKCGLYWGFAYSPEFIRQGNVVNDYANPDILLIGASDVWAANRLQEFYETVVQNRPGIYHMSLESAEIAKIGLNATIVTKIAMANQIAWLCHHTPGANAKHVLGSIGADSRIGPGYFQAGLWPGGPCFPRDCRALAATMKQHGVIPVVSRAVSDLSGIQAAKLSCAITGHLPVGGGTVGLVGLTYKSGVSLLEESQSLLLANYLTAGAGGQIRVIAYDPDVAVGMSVQALHELVKQSDVIVVMTPKSQFQHLERMDLSGKILFDCWGYLDGTNADKHIVLGKGNAR